ncbi:MAG: hypothetical protein KY468_11945 [Armatimonadetes bacterium]|nr:hypothetical protein [Armatimonadota bacterium]
MDDQEKNPPVSDYSVSRTEADPKLPDDAALGSPGRQTVDRETTGAESGATAGTMPGVHAKELGDPDRGATPTNLGELVEGAERKGVG